MDIMSLMVLIRGGGDLATGVAYRLHKSGFPIIILELPQPLVVRRRVALATAVLEGEVQIEGLIGRLATTFDEAVQEVSSGIIPVLVSSKLPGKSLSMKGGSDLGDSPPHEVRGQPGHYSIVIDARMAKRNIDTDIKQASLVIGLGPGFTAGVDCHVVIETKRGHRLGRAIWNGPAAANTGIPGNIAGKGKERVLRAPVSGVANWKAEIGQLVEKGELLGQVNNHPITAPFNGAVRGLIAPGTSVRVGLKIGDIDARGDVDACFTISDKALAIGGGVLEAILTWMNDERAASN